MLNSQNSKEENLQEIPTHLRKSKPGYRKKINWQNYSKTLRKFNDLEARKINRICTILALVSFTELICSGFLYFLIMPWWLAIITAYGTWIIFTEYNLNTLYILYITIFRNNKLMLEMIEETKRWS